MLGLVDSLVVSCNDSEAEDHVTADSCDGCCTEEVAECHEVEDSEGEDSVEEGSH